jgi:hypothetical protein
MLISRQRIGFNNQSSWSCTILKKKKNWQKIIMIENDERQKYVWKFTRSMCMFWLGSSPGKKIFFQKKNHFLIQTQVQNKLSSFGKSPMFQTSHGFRKPFNISFSTHPTSNSNPNSPTILAFFWWRNHQKSTGIPPDFQAFWIRSQSQQALEKAIFLRHQGVFEEMVFCKNIHHINTYNLMCSEKKV